MATPKTGHSAGSASEPVVAWVVLSAGRTQNQWFAPALPNPATVSSQAPRDLQATQLLHDMRGGDAEASGKLLPLIYNELHKIADSLMRGERDDHTLQPTALVHEAYMRMIHSEAGEGFESRAHFLRVGARAMRNVLIDHARAKRAQKRGGKDGAKITLDEGLVLEANDAEGLLHVEETLQQLSELDPQLGDIVEMRFFGGLKDAEIGLALGISERTVQRCWRTARAFLSREMAKSEDGPRSQPDNESNS